MDIRYALRGLRRSPLFAASVSATIGLGLGVLCSAFALVNAYVLRPIDLPDPRSLFALSWETATSSRRQLFSPADFEALRQAAPHFSALTAGRQVVAMQADTPINGVLVAGNYFQLLGGQPRAGRTIGPADVSAPGAGAVVVLSDSAWRARFGADPDIVGKPITLGRQRFDVIGVMPPGFGLPGEELAAFWAPWTMAAALGVPEPSADRTTPSLNVVGRLQSGFDVSQARLWFEAWLRNRFPAGSEFAPARAHVESRATRIQLNGPTSALFTMIMFAFGLVLLVACANVTNLILARGFGRQQEIAVRLSLGATRGRVIRQLLVEGLVLAVPSAAVGLGLTMAAVRAFPAIITATFPPGIASVDVFLVPLDPDVRVIALLIGAAVLSTVLVSLAPAVRVTRANLVRASKGLAALDAQRSRLRTALVAMQIGACVLFLVGAGGLIQQTRRVANANTGLSYERVADVRVAPGLRADVVARLAADPAVERVAATWRSSLSSRLLPMGVIASGNRVETLVGFTVVSPEYFPLFDIDVVRGRTFTPLEADEGAAVVLVSTATARLLWPGLDPVGQTLDIVPPLDRTERRPLHTRVRVIGVTEDVSHGEFNDRLDTTCVYFATGFRAPGEIAMLVKARATASTLQARVAAAVNAVQPDAPFRLFVMRDWLGMARWIFQAFSTAAAVLAALGLVLAFSGTYAVVAFLVAQRTREFGIRMALGATVHHVTWSTIREMGRTASLGLGAGLVVAFGLARLFSAALDTTPRVGAVPYVAAAAIVLTATLTAALLPARRTARIDPAKALRVE